MPPANKFLGEGAPGRGESPEESQSRPDSLETPNPQLLNEPRHGSPEAQTIDLSGALAAALAGNPLGNLVRNFPLLASISRRKLAEDPALFILQVLRRLPPQWREKLRALPQFGRPGSLGRAAWMYAMDLPDAARKHLQAFLGRASESESKQTSSADDLSGDSADAVTGESVSVSVSEPVSASPLASRLSACPPQPSKQQLLTCPARSLMSRLPVCTARKLVRRLRDELCVQLSLPLPSDAGGDAQAKQLWEAGDLDGALAAAKNANAATQARLQGEARTLDSSLQLVLPDASHRQPNASSPSSNANADHQRNATNTDNSTQSKRDGQPSLANPQLEPRGPFAGEAASAAPTRVLFSLTNSVPWTNSGYALRSHALLQAEQRAGSQVLAATRIAYPVTIGRPQASRFEVIDQVPYCRLLPRRLPVGAARQVGAQAKMLAQLARDFRPHVLHTTTNYLNGIAAESVARALDIPWVYEMRGNMEQTWVARQSQHLQDRALASQRYRLMRDRETWCANRADAVVALSQVQRDDLVARGVSADKILVIPNSVDEALLQVPRTPESVAQARRALGLTGDLWVGSVSALVDYEGFPTLLHALRQLRDQGLAVKCALVGDGVARPALQDLAEALGLADQVVFPGKVPPAQAERWYQALDVMVIPRQDTPVTRSVTPVKGLTAMALGIPQVVADLPALCEVGCAQGQGLSFPAGDAEALAHRLRDLLKNPQLRDQLGQAGRKAAAKRTWAEAGRALHDLHQGLRGVRRAARTI